MCKPESTRKNFQMFTIPTLSPKILSFFFLFDSGMDQDVKSAWSLSHLDGSSGSNKDGLGPWTFPPKVSKSWRVFRRFSDFPARFFFSKVETIGCFPGFPRVSELMEQEPQNWILRPKHGLNMNCSVAVFLPKKYYPNLQRAHA